MNAAKKELVDHRLRQAQTTLRAAGELQRLRFFRDSVNRAYYAMFYAVNALLAARDLGASKHSGVISLFGQTFVKTGQISGDHGRHLRQAFELRQENDYADFGEPSEEQTLEILSKASAFIDEAQRVWQLEQTEHSP